MVDETKSNPSSARGAPEAGCAVIDPLHDKHQGDGANHFDDTTESRTTRAVAGNREAQKRSNNRPPWWSNHVCGHFR